MRKPKMNQPITGPLVTEYCTPRNLRKLSVMIVTQAIKDLDKSPRRALDALAWLTDPRSDLSLHMEIADMGHLDIFRMLTSGKTRKLSELIRQNPRR